MTKCTKAWLCLPLNMVYPTSIKSRVTQGVSWAQVKGRDTIDTPSSCYPNPKQSFLHRWIESKGLTELLVAPNLAPSFNKNLGAFLKKGTQQQGTKKGHDLSKCGRLVFGERLVCRRGTVITLRLSSDFGGKGGGLGGVLITFA